MAWDARNCGIEEAMEEISVWVACIAGYKCECRNEMSFYKHSRASIGHCCSDLFTRVTFASIYVKASCCLSFQCTTGLLWSLWANVGFFFFFYYYIKRVLAKGNKI